MTLQDVTVNFTSSGRQTDGTTTPIHVRVTYEPAVSSNATITAVDDAGTLVDVELAVTPTPPPPPGDRNPLDWPYNSTSPWNTPLGADWQPGPPFWDPTLVQLHNVMAETAPGWRYSPDDPLVPLWKFDKGHYWRTPDLDPNMTQTSEAYRVPEGFLTTRDQPDWCQDTPDNPAGLVADDGRTVRQLLYTFVMEVAGERRILAGLTGRGALDVYGDGRGDMPPTFLVGVPHKPQAAHGASGLCGWGGVLTSEELFGPDPIRHALTINGYMHGWGARVAGHNQSCWPAWYADSDTKIYGGDGDPGFQPILPMGALVALLPDLDLDTLELETAPARKLAEAVQRFGIYMTEESGSNSWRQFGWCMRWGCVTEGNARGLNLGGNVNRHNVDDGGAWFRDSTKIVSACRQVLDNTPSNVGGHGVRLYDLAPPLTQP